MNKLNDLSLEQLWELFPITLEEYNPLYLKYYDTEEKALRDLLKDFDIHDINHIGSTAIKDIKAKPIIDILVELSNLNQAEEVAQVLQNNGWLLMNTSTTPFKYSFNKGYTPLGYADKVFHLHLKETGDCDECYFRDYLNKYPLVKEQYQQLKIDLLKKHPLNRDAYTLDKTAFVNEVVTKAKEEFR